MADIRMYMAHFPVVLVVVNIWKKVFVGSEHEIVFSLNSCDSNVMQLLSFAALLRILVVVAKNL